MLLHTLSYLIFLLGVFTLYWLIPKITWRKGFLLFASYVFYALFDWRFLTLLILLTFVTFFIGSVIPGNPNAKRYTWVSVIINLSILGVFKYANFFIHSFQSTLSIFGLSYLPPSLYLILPVGISFYTFQAIAYTIEIYRNKIEPTSKLLDFALYLGFFPKLIAGPFVRPKNFLEQLEKPSISISPTIIGVALSLLLVGLVKKIVIADSLAGISDVAFRAASLPNHGDSFPSPLYIQGFYLYAFQIYADFSGYTDIAIASALLLGYHLPENFRQPYISATLTSFWNRWHMTLTQWFREYVFYPLSRRLLQTYKRKYTRLIHTTVNLTTMLLIGLWHGPAWTFVIWGLWHGVLLSVEKLLMIKPVRRWSIFFGGVITFHLVGIGWVIFRSSSMIAAINFLTGLLAFNQMSWLGYYLPSILITAALVFGIDILKLRSYEFKGRWHQVGQVMIIAAIFLLITLTSIGYARGYDARPFIYSQF